MFGDDLKKKDKQKSGFIQFDVKYGCFYKKDNEN